MVAGKVADLLRESRLRAEGSGGDFTAADKAPITTERPAAHGGLLASSALKADKVIDFAHSRAISGAMSSAALGPKIACLKP